VRVAVDGDKVIALEEGPEARVLLSVHTRVGFQRAVHARAPQYNPRQPMSPVIFEVVFRMPDDLDLGSGRRVWVGRRTRPGISRRGGRSGSAPRQARIPHPRCTPRTATAATLMAPAVLLSDSGGRQ
jgi:hypothetical protein